MSDRRLCTRVLPAMLVFGLVLVLIPFLPGARAPVPMQETRGDLNLDGVITLEDARPFITALRDPGKWQRMYGRTWRDLVALADFNNDRDVTRGDIPGFAALMYETWNNGRGGGDGGEGGADHEDEEGGNVWDSIGPGTVDLDVDSDNDDGTAQPSRTALEDVIEDIANLPGKEVAVNNNTNNGGPTQDKCINDIIPAEVDLVPAVVDINPVEGIAPIVTSLDYQLTYPSNIRIWNSKTRGTFEADVIVSGSTYSHVVWILGDMNGDASFNGGDIDPFFLALADPAAFAEQYPGVDPNGPGDINDDGVLDGGDIIPFFAALGGVAGYVPVRLWIEGRALSEETGDTRIVVAADTDGDGVFDAGDGARTTVSIVLDPDPIDCCDPSVVIYRYPKESVTVGWAFEVKAFFDESCETKYWLVNENGVITQIAADTGTGRIARLRWAANGAGFVNFTAVCECEGQEAQDSVTVLVIDGCEIELTTPCRELEFGEYGHMRATGLPYTGAGTYTWEILSGGELLQYVWGNGRNAYFHAGSVAGTVEIKVTYQGMTLGCGLAEATCSFAIVPPPDPSGEDPDGDGLTNWEESQHGSDPNNPDTDSDGLTDGNEVNVHGTIPTDPDTDDDGVWDGCEVAHGWDPLDDTFPVDGAAADSDHDSLPDMYEVDLDLDGVADPDIVAMCLACGAIPDPCQLTSPFVPDSDGDGIKDGCEVVNNWDPTNPASPSGPPAADPDQDGVPTGQEECDGTNPEFEDSDKDGLDDALESGSMFCTNPLDADTDHDGLDDGFEYNDGGVYTGIGTDPCRADTDGDGLLDGFEYTYRVEIWPLAALDPLHADSNGNGTLDSLEDPDGDGLDNLGESSHGTNPALADSDGDGVNDGDEVNQGSDPNDPGDLGQAPDPDDLVDVELTIGPNGGHGAWTLRVGPHAVSVPYGETKTEVFKFRKGQTYDINVLFGGTDPAYYWPT